MRRPRSQPGIAGLQTIFGDGGKSNFIQKNFRKNPKSKKHILDLMVQVEFFLVSRINWEEKQDLESNI